MDSLREPTPGLDGFQLPTHDASRAEWERAFERLNAVRLTPHQIATGYFASMGDDGAYGDIVELRRWCEIQDIHPADVAAEAILVRMLPIIGTGHPARARLSVAEMNELSLRHLAVSSEVVQFMLAH